MELPVYTGLLRVDRRIGQIGHMELPRMVSLTEALVFAGTFLALLGIGHLLALHLSLGWDVALLFGPALAAANLAGKPVADRKPIHLWAFSQLRYFLAEPRVLARLVPVREPSRVRVRLLAWSAAAKTRTAPARRTKQATSPVQATPAEHPLRELARWRLESAALAVPVNARVIPVARQYRAYATRPVRPAWVSLAVYMTALMAVCAALGTGIVVIARTVA